MGIDSGFDSQTCGEHERTKEERLLTPDAIDEEDNEEQVPNGSKSEVRPILKDAEGVFTPRRRR